MTKDTSNIQSLTAELTSFVDFTGDAKSREYLKQLEEDERQLAEEENETTAETKKKTSKRQAKNKSKSYRDRFFEKIFDENFGIDWFNNQCMKIDPNLSTSQKLERLMITWNLWLHKLDSTKSNEDMMEFFGELSNQVPKVKKGLDNIYNVNGMDTLENALESVQSNNNSNQMEEIEIQFD